MDQKQLDHHANQKNTDSIAHKHVLDNRSRQKDSQAAPQPGDKSKK